MDEVNHQSHIPYYVQVKDVIRDRIAAGVWEPGARLPSEAELCEIFGVSRTVVRQALQDLIYEGLIVRRKGKGSFVAEHKIREHLVQKLTGFYQDMVDQGYEPVTETLAQDVRPASAEVAGYLGIQPATPVTEIVRVRSVRETPIVFVRTFLPYALCPNLVDEDLSSQSLYALLENKYGLYIANGRRTIHALPAEGRVAQLLEVDRGAPLFRLDSVSYLQDGTPVEYYYAYHRGDQSQFEVELVRVRDANGFHPSGELPASNKVAVPSP